MREPGHGNYQVLHMLGIGKANVELLALWAAPAKFTDTTWKQFGNPIGN
jgi:hypothetical protein